MRGWIPFRASLAGALLASGLAAGCASGPRPPAPGEPMPESPAREQARRTLEPPDVIALYRRMGLLAEAGETPFVGTLSFFAAPRGDSTLIVLTVSLANRVLRFAREGDRFRAGYHVALEVRQGTEVVRDLRARETVRVLAYRETQREDESVLFRQVFALSPGTYDLRLTVRDESATRGSAVEATVGVPRFVDGSVSSPVPFYEAEPREERDSLPHLIATPRATAVFGRDSLMLFYAEGYGPGDFFPLRITVQSEGANDQLWSDSVNLPRRDDLFSGTFGIPISRLGVGVMTVGVSRPEGRDTVRVPLFVAFGEDLPVASFSEMLNYLRYFAMPDRIQALRDARPEQRAALWAAFLRETDDVPQTPQHESLLVYFGRIAVANSRFREEGTLGWLTDRGRVLVALGEPDQQYQPTVSELGSRGRVQIWEYRDHRLQIVFVDQSGFGRWKMTLSSESEFERVARRQLVE